VLRRHGPRLIPEAEREGTDAFLKRLALSEWPAENGAPVSRYKAVQLKMRELAGRYAPERNGR